MTDPLLALRESGPEPALESQALGEWALAEAGLEAPGGLVAVAPSADARRVPWARRAGSILIPSDEATVLASLPGVAVAPGQNLADEERDEVPLSGLQDAREIPLAPAALWLRGALTRAVMMAGALERICQLSLDHARERRQFGRPIGGFQAVQALVVTIAQQTALVGAAVDGALAREGPFEIATAKVLAGRAAVTAARAAHQVHGAVGVTRTHPLGLETRRLWAWRCEYGDEQEWADRIGDAVLQAGPDRLYPVITAGSAGLEL